jgi:hypothetical protein
MPNGTDAGYIKHTGISFTLPITASGNISASGTGSFAHYEFPGSSGNITGHLIPSADATYDLGSTNSEDWNNLYVRAIDIFNQRFRLGYTGTTATLSDHSSVGDGFQFMHLNQEILRLGNDGDYTANFSANITASGNISSSGTGIFNKIQTNGIYLDAEGTKYLAREANGSVDIAVAGGGITNVNIMAPITASGNISASGNLYVDEIWTSGNTTITGALRATTKSFVIDTPDGGKLEYGSLEGRSHDVFHKGKCDNNVIELPKEWEWLIDDTTLTVQLTAIGKHQNLYVKEIKNNKVYISAGIFKTPNCYFLIHANRKDTKQIEHDN